MKIIDAHIHFQPGNVHFDRLAREIGHKNSEAYIGEAFSAAGIEYAIVMGNRSMSVDDHAYPGSMRYCLGIHREPLESADAVDLAECHLLREQCAGLKIYAGYTQVDLDDRSYAPYYKLAARYDKPVAVHTGVTSSSSARLDFCHPLKLDAAAAAYPRTRFVMCHFGNPWFADAAAVLEKNPNVSADLSGLLVGPLDIEAYICRQRRYLEQLRTWIEYVEAYDKFLFGTDWPLIDFDSCIRLVRRVIPEEHWEAVFYGNARRVYGLI